MTKLDFISDETQVGEPVVEISPSGKYRLVITRHKTEPHCWNYTRGKVFNGDDLVAEIHRNYPEFPFAWVEEHPETGYDYLLCGENYQGYTVVELNTGEQRSYLEPFGFCWAEVVPDEDGKYLTVCGCFWGGNFMYRKYDFTHPLMQPYGLLDQWWVEDRERED